MILEARWSIPEPSQDELYLCAVFLMLAGFVICFQAYKFSATVIILTGGTLFGVFLWNELVPQFVNDMLVCYVAGCAVAVVGAVVGGVVALLLKWLSVGATLGTLIGLGIVLADAGRLIVTEEQVLGVFITTLCGSMLLSWFREDLGAVATFAAFGGLLFSYGVDLCVGGQSLILNTGVVLQMRWPEGEAACWESGEGCDTVQALLALWAVLAVLGLLVQGQLSGACRLCRPKEADIPATTSATKVSSLPVQKTFTYPEGNGLMYNYFKPDQLPPALKVHMDVIFRTAENLANFFGFQDDNVRSQVEHVMTLVANHRRYADAPAFDLKGNYKLPPATPVHSLHTNLFNNYKGWCKNLKIPPRFCPPDGGSREQEVDALFCDIVLWLCIWGEAANLRHMPECLCFLYHKMMEEYLVNRYQDDTKSLYAGYFLDHIVSPVWEVVVRHHKVKGDHITARNYDDFNEFFWSPTCLSYSYRDIDAAPGVSATPRLPSSQHLLLNNNDMTSSRHGMPPAVPLHKALDAAPKTFLEKRSLLSTILTFHRVLEFHLVTFQMCACLAFAEMLVWDVYYNLQIFSSVLLAFNLYAIVWCMLEVWQAYPGINVTGTAKTGFLIRLSTRFVLLSYQTLYYMWSLDNPSDKAGVQVQGTPMFWWWQYLWLSLLSLSTFVCDGFCQIFPYLSTAVLTRNSDYFNALLNLCYPLSRLYVGKEVHESLWNAAKYIFFWLTLFAWKMYFSYQYEVKILVLPSVEIFDDYVNFPGHSFIRAAALIVLRWVPQLLIYIIDSSIWFACWSAMAGSIVGFQERLGEVRDFATLKSHFMRIPEEFCAKVISASVTSREASTVDLQVIGSNTPTETTSLLGGSGRANQNSIQRYLTEFLDVRTQKWAAFAAVWNEVINKMRDSDVISNKEKDMLKFHTFDGCLKPVYLPIFQTAGCVEQAVAIMAEEAKSWASEDIEGLQPVQAKQRAEASHHQMMQKIEADRTVHEAVSEVWELGAWFLRQLLGPIHDADIARVEALLNEYMNNGESLSKLRLNLLGQIRTDATAIVETLQGQLKRRALARSTSKPQTPTSGAGGGAGGHARPSANAYGMRKSISTSGLSGMMSSTSESNMTMTDAAHNMQSPRHNNLQPQNFSTRKPAPDKTRDQVRDRIRPLFHSVKNMIKSVTGRGSEILDRLSAVLTLGQGFMWDDEYASGRLDVIWQDDKARSILNKLYGLLAVQPSEAEPVSPEARRRLAFFANSLFMDMPRAPPLMDMMSWTCMTPFYSEDVIYSRSDLEKRNEDGLSTLLYLQALYKHDWRNFLERMELQDEQQIWSKRILQDTRLWASLRAQTLSRTVEGMMYYEAALRLLAHLEKINPDLVENLVKQKFQYVVSCQVYGRMKKNQDPKADDIDRLLKRFPNFRVAYIDECRVTHGTTTEFYSVLVKAQEDRKEVEEVYRIKLPGNPVVGEGKPENQNHAIIFTRGEYVQAIDMNQEGYFEEALKMRCLLQEFSIPAAGTGQTPRIVGFREHIFTGAVSSLANYMALQELSFVTLGQRVLNNPLRIRQHYGHPDIFDKLFFCTRGGMSKASKGINLSEDIFAGYNNSIRGGEVQFKEYKQVGKGRDVGMQQIYKFEAKLAQGAAEQSLSRDTNRLGLRLDFFRLVSFYFGGLGYYIGNFITVATIVFVVYFMLALAVFEVEKIGERKITPEGTLQMMLAGMGILNTLPMLATLMVEKGLATALMTVAQIFVSGGPMYFMFHIQTRAHYFYQTLLAGGAQYRATGRGFVTHHSSFDDLYRFFATSHFYLGFELAASLIIILLTSSAHQYIGRTWSLWLASVSFMFAPFWFNPLSFEWGKVVEDYKKWMRWMSGTGGGGSHSWEVWWREENEYISKVGFGQKLQFMMKPIFYTIIGVGIAMPKVQNMEALTPLEVKQLVRTLVLYACLFVGSVVIDKCGKRFSPWIRRSGKLIISTSVFCCFVSLCVVHYAYIRVAVGLYYIFAAASSVGVILGWTGLKLTYQIHDLIIGHCLFLVLFIFAALQFPKDIQTWLLFHNALSQGVVIEDILKYARRSQEQSAGSEDFVWPDGSEELKKIIQKQETMLAQLMADKQGSMRSVDSNGDLTVIMMPLADDNDTGHVERANMMRASSSTLNLSQMAHTSTRSAQAAASASAAQQNASSTDFHFSSAPTAFPPRN